MGLTCDEPLALIPSETGDEANSMFKVDHSLFVYGVGLCSDICSSFSVSVSE